MAGHNLGIVISFEFMRTVKKASFWITTLAVPLVMAAVAGLLVFSSSAASVSANERDNADLSFAYTDQSGLIDAGIATKLGGEEVIDGKHALEKVRAGELDAYFAYPKHPAEDPVKVYGTDRGLFHNGEYSAIADRLLDASVDRHIGNAQLNALAAGAAVFSTTTFDHGKVSEGIGSVIPPLIFLVAFYTLILFLGNQMLHSTVDEKENRISEMLLTTFRPTTLIVGKIVSLFMVGGIQLGVLLAPAIPAAIGFFVLAPQMDLAALGLPNITIEPDTMLVGALLLAGGFLLFTGAIVAVGAIMPTAKEAGGLFSVLVVLIFVPLYAASVVISDPESPVVQFFTYFPFSAPVTAMIRNSVGSLAGWEAALVITELFIAGALMLMLAVRLFRHGSIGYGTRLSLHGLLHSRRTAKSR